MRWHLCWKSQCLVPNRRLSRASCFWASSAGSRNSRAEDAIVPFPPSRCRGGENGSPPARLYCRPSANLPHSMSDDALFSDAMEYVLRYRASLAERPVGARATAAELRAHFDVPLSEEGEDARHVLRALAVDGDKGLVASAGPR